MEAEKAQNTTLNRRYNHPITWHNNANSDHARLPLSKDL